MSLWSISPNLGYQHAEISCTDGAIDTGTPDGTAELQSLHAFRAICTVYRLVYRFRGFKSIKQGNTLLLKIHIAELAREAADVDLLANYTA